MSTEAPAQSPSFQARLDAAGAPTRVGDVRLRYDGQLLLGEANRPLPSWSSALGFAVAISAAVGAAALVVFSSRADAPPLAASLSLFALLLGGAVLVREQRRRRPRRFVLNFAREALRLDFAPPPRGLPPTITVSFDDVRAVELVEQVDRRWALVIELTWAPAATRLREVLCANIADDGRPSAERLERLLRGAFGLGRA